ncbi:MAG TPA: benzoylformate decarboxylase [Solirubrobacteraceae bacterium]|nr:benzoylformate decarboxylase [Solirubrobacteraceae bacterium]
MSTVREATIELLRKRGMTTLFGNPGSTELPMLSDYPADFRYILGLQESVAVGIADGYAQATGRPALVNLHTAPGLGNGMGAIFNAQANKSPLVVTAGQQYRSLMTLQANLTNRDATRMPHPLVKWSWEPPCAQDVPHALSRAIHTAALAPRGPVFVSIPMDDWYAEVRDEDELRHQTTRAVSGGGAPERSTIDGLARRLIEADTPALVAGPDIDAAGGWEAAVRLAEHARLPVYATPATGGGRLGFPENHPLFQAVLPPAVQPLGEALAPHDFVLAVGTSIFPYYPNIPGPLLAPGTSLTAVTSDPDEAARAPMGDAIVADVALTLTALADAVEALAADRERAESGIGAAGTAAAGVAGAGALWRQPPPARPAPEPAPITDPISPSTAVRVLADAFPDDGIVVLESPSATPALRNQLRIGRPGSYYFSAGGGLGFGMPAAIGVQLACPDRPVVCVIGEGSAQYAVQSFWTAAAYKVPVTYLVLRNEEYAILKFFSLMEEIPNAPGLDLPALDTAAVAAGYGLNAARADGPEQLAEELRRALASGRPELVETRVAPGMALA